jgi:hypothetical protein
MRNDACSAQVGQRCQLVNSCEKLCEHNLATLCKYPKLRATSNGVILGGR